MKLVPAVVFLAGYFLAGYFLAGSGVKKLHHCTGLGSCTHGDFETVCYAHDQEAEDAEGAVREILRQCKEALDRNGGSWTCTRGSIKCHDAAN